MFFCSCGRCFLSEHALGRHQEDRIKNNPSSKCKTVTSNNQNSDVGQIPLSPKSAAGLMYLSGKDRWIKNGAGDIVSSISLDSLQLSGEEPRVSNTGGHELLCSYNWVHRPEPTVYVPGSAPIYKETAVPIALRRDSGLQYVDQNAARLPQYPFEVVFHAAEIMNPKIKFDAIDVLINRNSLRKFLSFCQGRSQDSFRVNLFTVSNTLIVERCTRTATEMLHGALNPGYGHVFERAVTEIPADLQDSTAHHRVLRYNLGGLECAVRFEVDASVVHCSADSQAEEARDPNAAIQEGVDSLIGGLNDMSLHKEGCASKHGSVTVIPLGAGTAQECTVEIKANSQSPAKAVPQMWFGQTPYLVRGHHSGNTFTRVTFDDMRPHFQRWESSAHNQAALQKMVLLLGQLRDVVKATGNKSCVAIYEKAPGQPIVRVFLSTVERKPLPDSVIGKFWETKP